MANEIPLRDWLENPIDFTVADGAGIEKGALLALSDPRTAAPITTEAGKIAGIAAREKVASDGRTRLAVFRKGIFDIKASGAIPVGSAVIASGDSGLNTIKIAPVTASGAAILGYALETATDAETIQVLVDVGCGGAQIS
jgi:hypothetical protein